ncbi:MAG: hypothetical protein ACLPKT_22750 [Methylocella sp.]
MKTRAMAAWGESRGFETRIIERRFDASNVRQDDETDTSACRSNNPENRP